MADSIDFDDISGDIGVDLASRAFTKNQGESLSFQFSYKQEGIDQALNGIYSVSHFTKLGEDLITFGTTSIVPGIFPIPDKVRFELTDSQSAALASGGRYYGTIEIVNLVDLTETVNVLDFNIRILSQSITQTIPISTAEVSGILELGDDFPIEKMNSVVRLAESRIKAWLPTLVFDEALKTGWPDRLISECEYCTAMMLRLQIYENDDFAKDEYKICRETFSNYKIDSDGDGSLDLGGARTIPILRQATDVLSNERTRRYSNRYDNP